MRTRGRERGERKEDGERITTMPLMGYMVSHSPSSWSYRSDKPSFQEKESYDVMLNS